VQVVVSVAQQDGGQTISWVTLNVQNVTRESSMHRSAVLLAWIVRLDFRKKTKGKCIAYLVFLGKRQTIKVPINVLIVLQVNIKKTVKNKSVIIVLLVLIPT